jgi:MscS family membrane protein
MPFTSSHYHAALAFIVSISIALALSSVQYFAYQYALPRAKQKGRLWQEALLSSAHWPVMAFIWVLSLSYPLEGLFNGGLSAERFTLIRQVLTLILLFWFFMRLIRGWEKNAVKRLSTGHKRVLRDNTSVHALAQLLRITLITIVTLTTMNAAGISVSTLLAFGGIGGLAISFAAKDTLANFIGGLMIYWDRPFSVGDTIKSPGQPIDGVVESIGWRLTCIRTPDRRPLYIPNGLFSNVMIENASRMTHRRIAVTLGVSYDDLDKITVITQNIEAYLRQHPAIDTSLDISACLTELGNSSLDIFVEAYTRTLPQLAFRALRQEIYLKLLDIISVSDAQLAYPTTTVNLTGMNDYLGLMTELTEGGDGGEGGPSLQ